MPHPRSSTILHNPTAERDTCGVGFVPDAKGRPAREIVEAVLEGRRRVEHRGATAADGKTSDGAGVLLPISPRARAVARLRSDVRAGSGRIPVPALLAAGAVHGQLIG